MNKIYQRIKKHKTSNRILGLQHFIKLCYLIYKSGNIYSSSN